MSPAPWKRWKWPASPLRTGPASYIPLDEMVGKLRAAVHARRDASLVIVGRTTLDTRSPMDTVLEKLRAFAIGVDALFVPGMKTEVELMALAATASLPLMLGGSRLAKLANREALARHGVRVALQGHTPLRTAVEGARQMMQALRDGVEASAAAPPVVSDEVMAKLTRSSAYDWLRKLCLDVTARDIAPNSHRRVLYLYPATEYGRMAATRRLRSNEKLGWISVLGTDAAIPYFRAWASRELELDDGNRLGSRGSRAVSDRRYDYRRSIAGSRHDAASERAALGGVQ
jgi:Phosphoenolpyruvate phosphomutase